MFEDLDPANQFAMEGLNMAFAAELVCDGKPLPKDLSLDIMIEKLKCWSPTSNICNWDLHW